MKITNENRNPMNNRVEFFGSLTSPPSCKLFLIGFEIDTKWN